MLYNFFKAAEVLVLPSIHKSEAFGIVLLEAMACGTPVISTELGTGTSFVNADKISGLVVPPRDSRSLRKAIEDIIDNEAVRSQYGREAAERVQTLFTLEKMLDIHYKLYSELIKN
jgi:rhamnosyl/mannosyltransferase